MEILPEREDINKHKTNTKQAMNIATEIHATLDEPMFVAWPDRTSKNNIINTKTEFHL